jgi:LPXTG-site transpeptidase (sortase) family protein
LLEKLCSLLFALTIIYYIFVSNLSAQEIEKVKIENFIKTPSAEEQKYKSQFKENLYEYKFLLEIPKINLKKGLNDVNSKYNNVNYNVEINKKSDMPDVSNGNFILEAHSGNSKVGFFNKLEKLKENDLVYIYYNNIKYTYKINNYYDINYNGKAKIKRDYSKNTITLITCKKNEINKQIIYIGYLLEKHTY